MNTKKFHLIIISLFLIIILNSKPLSVLAKTCSEAKGICYDATVCDSLGINGWYTDPTAECPPPYVCCVQFTGNEEETEDTSKTGLPKEIQSPTSVIPYEFETGIPGIVGAGQSLQRMTLAEFVKLLIRYVFRISGILAFVMIVYGGILYLISGGDAKKQKSAQETIAGAVIGLILLFAFWLILNTINPDILRAPKIGINNTPENGTPSSSSPPSPPSPPLSPNHPSEIRELAKNLLNNQNIVIKYSASKKDLQDVVNNKCTDPYKNSTNPNGNCISAPNYPNCPTINGNLIKAISALPDYAKKAAEPIRVPGIGTVQCSQIIEVSPFISDHYYCSYSDSSHKDGKAVDVTLYPKTNNITENECTAHLARALCPNYTATTITEYQYICTVSLNGINIQVYSETEGKQPHLHLRLP